MLLCVIYCIFYSSHYMLLGAYTGMLMSLVSASRNIFFYYYAKCNKKNNIINLVIFTLVAFIFGIVCYQNYFSIVSIVSNIISTYSIWQENVMRYRLLAIPVSLRFIVYATHINSLFSLIVELILLGIEIVGVLNLKNKFDNNLVGNDVV